MLIFLLIVGVPFVIALVSLLRPDLVERVIREPNRAGFEGGHRSQDGIVTYRDRAGSP